ncbi:MAG: NADH-quinone oxidoreductase subunit F, partial [Chloroflexi bacterium]|nr:NADH-quinone oxidoreductase subunit F [Chloroflexota bacterium]
GLAEAPMGITLRQALEEIGGGVPNGKALKAAQLGGPLGGFLPAASLDQVLDFDSLAGTGAMLGSGGIIALDQDVCIVEFTRILAAFNQRESCGKCIPCRVGTKRVLEIYDALVQGRGRPEHLEQILELAQTMTTGSLCGLGQLAGTPLRASLRYFREEYEAHIKERRCPTGQCPMGGGI